MRPPAAGFSFTYDTHSRRAFRKRSPPPGEGGRAVKAPGPVGDREVLVMAELVATIEDDRRALGGVAVLVRVGGDGGDAREPEIERGYVVAQLLGPGEEEAAEAAVGVEADASGPRQLRELLDGVDDAGGGG